MQQNLNSSNASRRRDPHIKVTLPVRLWGMDSSGSPFVQNVSTSDISSTGACVSGVTARLAVGEVIGMQHGAEKARFRVVWIKPVEGVGFNLGLSAVDESKCLWRSHLATALELESSATSADRRRHVRIPCDGSVEFAQSGNSYRMWATATDISGGGCYLQTVSTMPVNTPIEMKITLGHTDIECGAVVRTSHPGIGMGVQFRALDGENRQTLHSILEQLESEQADKLPPHMRVLAQLERTRECLTMLDNIIRQDPTRMLPGLAEPMAELQAKVNYLLREQRGNIKKEKVQATT